MSTDLKLIAFDLFGTLVDMSETPREEIRHYLDQCVDPVWQPLKLPESWKRLRWFNDIVAIESLANRYRLFILSNAPASLSDELQEPLRYCGYGFDGAIDLASIRRYKPHPECYLYACKIAGVEPHEAMMVTANPTFGPYPFGDIQIAGAIGMQTRLIRNPGGPADLIALAEELGC